MSSVSEISDTESFADETETVVDNKSWLIWLSVVVGVILLIVIILLGVWLYFYLNNNQSKPQTPQQETPAQQQETSTSQQQETSIPPLQETSTLQLSPPLTPPPQQETNIYNVEINPWQQQPMPLPPPSWGFIRKYQWERIGFLMQYHSIRPPPHPKPNPCRTCPSGGGNQNLCSQCQHEVEQEQHHHDRDRSHTRKLPLYGRNVAHQRDMMQYMAMDVPSGIQLPVLVPPSTRYLNTNDIVRVKGESGEWVVQLSDQIWTDGGSCSTCHL